jgi:peptidoglycan/LPS O-acetylase OafA/YrhL
MSKRLKDVDSLRGIAILGVIAIHSIYNADSIVKINGGNSNSVLTALLNQGKYGVELFFFISGWLLNSLYNKTEGKELRKYWIRRLARIYPLWVIFIIIGIIRLQNLQVLNLDMPDLKNLTIFQFVCVVVLNLTFLTFVTANSWNTLVPGGWSIQSEILHYLLFWWLLKIKWNNLVAIYILLGTLTFISQFIKEGTVNNFIYNLIQSWIRLNLFSTIVYFLLGMAYSKILGNKFKINRKSALSFKNLLAALVFLSLPLNFGHNSIAIIFIISSVYIVKISPQKLLRILSKIGKYSYFIYFSHFVVIDGIYDFYSTQTIIQSYETSQMLMFLIFFSLSLGLSFIMGHFSFRFIEYPIINSARKLTGK